MMMGGRCRSILKTKSSDGIDGSVVVASRARQATGTCFGHLVLISLVDHSCETSPYPGHDPYVVVCN